jgi:cytochrome P450
LFLPDRFIRSSPFNPHPSITSPDPRSFAFGYGRRICPGIEFAEATLFISIATLMATVSFDAPQGSQEQLLRIYKEYESGVAVAYVSSNSPYFSKANNDI